VAADGGSRAGSSWQARLPFYYGWVVVAAAFATNFISTGVMLWSLSVFVGPMTSELDGWRRSDLFGALALRSIITAIGVPFISRFLDRPRGAIVLMALSGVLETGVLVGVSRVNHPGEFVALFGVGGGIAGMAEAWGVSSAIVPKWFVRRRPRAMALSTMGTGAAALVMPLVVTGLIQSLGWRSTWVVLAGATFAIIVPLSLLMVRQPEDVGLHTDGATEAVAREARRTEDRSFTAGQAFRMPVTWLLVVVLFMTSLNTVGLPANIVPMFASRGFTAEGAALALTLYGLMSVIARFGWGILAERTHVRTSVVALTVYAASVMLLLILAGGNKPALMVLAAATGYAVGGMIVMGPLLWPTYLGRAHLGAINGFMYPITALASSMGPYVLSRIADSTGAYTAGLWLLLAAWLVAGVAMFMARPPAPATASPAPIPPAARH